jgi:hypothetical protein
MKEFFSLIGLKCVVVWRNGIEYLKVIWKYYRNPTFAKADLILLSQYLWSNPFRISRRFLMQKGLDAPYGETPLTTTEQIAHEAGITSSDVVYELGSGRGRAAIWLQTFMGCELVGIEMIPTFVSRAQKVVASCHLPKLSFRLEDMLTVDLTRATVVYLYGTCLTDQEIHQLIGNLQQLPSGARVITVSYTLTDYLDKENFLFQDCKSFPASFNWGTTDIYILKRGSSNDIDFAKKF